MATQTITAECAVAGGGPAGVMLGFLLARAGVKVVVFVKHEDFFRDFRGDTVHPSTLEVMHELGLLDDFLKLPHQKVGTLGVEIGDQMVHVADFSHLPTRAKFVALLPQWDFLDFLAAQAKRYPSFDLRMRAAVDELLTEGERVVGLKAAMPGGDLEVRAELVVGADGRHSTVRNLAGLQIEDLGAPMDVLWIRLSRRPEDGEDTAGRIEPGRFFIMLNRGDYWQCAFVIPKGGFNDLRRKGLEAFRLAIVALKPALATRVSEIVSWDDVRLLSVRVDRLKQWYRQGPVVHRRCGARDVADRRGGRQFGYSGCCRRRQHSHRTATGGAREGGIAAPGAETTAPAGETDARLASLPPRSRDYQRSCHDPPPRAALLGAHVGPLSRLAAASGPVDRHGLPAGARGSA